MIKRQKECGNCLHAELAGYEDPCTRCIIGGVVTREYWEPMPTTNLKFFFGDTPLKYAFEQINKVKNEN